VIVIDQKLIFFLLGHLALLLLPFSFTLRVPLTWRRETVAGLTMVRS
jgi:hypothetical protein